MWDIINVVIETIKHHLKSITKTFKRTTSKYTKSEYTYFYKGQERVPQFLCSV